MFNGKTILITGGTGTFGRAFVARLLSFPEIKKIIVFSRDEFKQSVMQNEVHDERLRYFLGDVRDQSRLERAFDGVDIVVHAAALKQVSALEHNPLEAVKTNVIGTQNVIDAALNRDIEKVLFISSDKAVQPINLYGATKLCAEKLTISANFYGSEKRRTRFSVVRYGNVIGSRGSIVELIERQRPAGVITLTDERMTRFWIPVNKVMQVILEGLNTMQGGEIFVPKTKSLRVVDLIKLFAPECATKTIGARPGEKLHEVLITDHETFRTKDLGLMFVILPEFIPPRVQGAYAYEDKPPFPAESAYISNHPDFLLAPDSAKKILED